MTDIQTQAQQKIQELLNHSYYTLAKHPLISQQQRQLLTEEQELMTNLEKGSFLYDSLLRILAIDSYSTSIMNQVNLYGQLCGMLTSTLQCFQQIGSSLMNGGQKRQLLERYNKTNQSLLQCIYITQEMLPKNPYIDNQNKLIQNGSIDSKIEESIITKLRNENQELRKKSQSNQIQITNMESKLTKLLKEHEGCQRGQSGNPVFNVELREQLSYKEAEIERMNEQFSFEIEKYNTVFEAMKRQLEQMKGYQNVDLIEQIQLLETQIVRLRQQRQRDQIIIRQLRTDNTMFSSAGYYSPRQSGSRYQSPRYNY